MIGTLRLLVCTGAIALAGYILEWTHPGWIPELTSDVCTLPNLRTDLYEETELGNELDVQLAALVARLQAKQRLLEDLIRARLTLLETATSFRDLDRMMPSDQRERFHRAWRGSSEVERYCHHIIQRAESELVQQPRRAAAVVARLKAEFQAAAETGAWGCAE